MQQLKVGPFSDESVFPNTERSIDSLKIREVLDDFSGDKGYNNPIDYVLCSLYPELESKCRTYYEEGGEKLKDIYSKQQISAIDSLMSKAVAVFASAYQDIKDQPQEDATASSISVSSPSPPMSQEVSITPRQVYTKDDVAQNREDLAPSMLRRKRRK